METKPSYRHSLRGALKRSRVLLLVGLLGASTLAHAGLFSDDEARTRITALAQENAALKAQMQSQNLDLLKQIETLKAEIARLRGQSEVVGNGLDTVQKRQRDMYTDLDSRLKSIESKPVMAAAHAAPAADHGEALKAYEAAFNLVKIGNYKGAIPALQNFITRYPDSPYAANAQYWVGNSLAAQGDNAGAAAALAVMIRTYPSSAKVPDAMLNLAAVQVDGGDHDSAKRTLKELVSKYPFSSAAIQAKKKLTSIK
jgi:tol-pal system protein YbgF